MGGERTADATDSDEGPEHDRPMTLFEHLEELRKRLFRCVLYVAAGMAVAWTFGDRILAVVILPYWEALLTVDGTLQVTDLSEAFFSTFKLYVVIGLFLAGPLVLLEVWGFVARGLYEKERRHVRIWFPVSLFLFVEGVAFYYFLVQPTTVQWLVGYQPYVPLPGGGKIPIDVNLRLSDALSFFLMMSLVMGLTFQLPLLMIFAQKIGVVNWRTFARYRRHFLMASLVAMAVLTPSGDALTLVVCMAPVVLLFEGGILVCRLMAPDLPPEEEDEEDAKS